ncbi:MAG: PIG-L family deacetylase [Actinomycetota bacterium]|nr:PIG-L family deacetylase [Actinomycetota bacterium]
MELLAAAPERVLAIYAHPDDPDVACGATLAHWAAAGAEVHIVLAAVGDKGADDPAADPGELARVRAGEVARAAAALGVASSIQLGGRDGELENDLALRRTLVSAVRSIRPAVVVCPDPTAVFFGEHYYNHRDHRVIGFAALDAVAPAAASPLYFPEAGAPWQVSTVYLSGTLEPNVCVEVSDTIGQKLEAVLAHRSQLGEGDEHFRAVLEARAREMGREVGVRYAESFRRLQLAAG